MCAALAGYKVACADISQEMLDKSENFAKTYLPERVARGKLSQGQADKALTKSQFNKDLEKDACDADFVIEAASEKIICARWPDHHLPVRP